MRLFIFLVIGMAFAQSARAAVTLHIEDVGLEGHYTSEPTPTRIRLRLSNPQQVAQNLSLTFRVRDKSQKSIPAPDYLFQTTVVLGPSEQRVVDVSILLPAEQSLLLTVEARDQSNQLIAEDERELRSFLNRRLIVLLCADASI